MTQYSFPAIVVRMVNGNAREIISNTNLQVNAPPNATFRYRIEDQPDDGGLPLVDIFGTRFGVSSNDARLPGSLEEASLGVITWDGGKKTIVLEQQVQIGPNEFLSFIVRLGGDPLPKITSPAAFNNFDNNRIDAVDVGTGRFAPGTNIRWDSIPGVTKSNNEVFTGSSAKDKFSGGRGDDTMFGEGGADTLLGGTGDDEIYGGRGRDVLNGGSNFDEVHYSDANQGVRISLNQERAFNDGFGGRDIIRNFEIIRGSMHDDRIVGDATGNHMRGLAGNDTLIGGNGRDYLRYDKDAEFGGRSGVNVNLQQEEATDGFGDTDTVRDFIRVQGTRFGDKLTGDGKNNILEGENGRDTLNGGQGNDTLEGGVGQDQLSGGAGRDVFVFSDGSGRDRIRDFTSGQDRIDLSEMTAIVGINDVRRNHATQEGDDVVISDGNGATIRIDDILLSDLSGSDFIF